MNLVSLVKQAYPQFTFVEGTVASWAPATRTITYTADIRPDTQWTLLHEIGHALLDHTSYESDMQLLKKEAAAWEKAVELATLHCLPAIDQEHVQSCLDTYRDWLHKRSTCPACGDHGVQPTQSLYKCLNCQSTWKVSSARFCRPYRLKSPLNTK